MNFGYCANPFEWSSPFCYQSSSSVESKSSFNYFEQSEEDVASPFDWKKHSFGAVSDDREITSSIGTPSPIASPTSSLDDNNWSWNFNDNAEHRVVGYNRPSPSYLAVGTYWPHQTRQQYKNIWVPSPSYDTFFKAFEAITTTGQSSQHGTDQSSPQVTSQQTKRKRRFPPSRKAKHRPRFTGNDSLAFNIQSQ